MYALLCYAGSICSAAPAVVAVGVVALPLYTAGVIVAVLSR